MYKDDFLKKMGILQEKFPSLSIISHSSYGIHIFNRVIYVDNLKEDYLIYWDEHFKYKDLYNDAINYINNKEVRESLYQSIEDKINRKTNLSFKYEIDTIESKITKEIIYLNYKRTLFITLYFNDKDIFSLCDDNRITISYKMLENDEIFEKLCSVIISMGNLMYLEKMVKKEKTKIINIIK